MKIADQRPDVAAVLGGDPVTQIAFEPSYCGLHSLIPAMEVALVDAVIAANPGADDPPVRQQKLADGGIEGESMRPLTGSVYQHGAGSVHHISGGHLLAARLQYVLGGAASMHADPTIDAEDGADS